MKTVKAENVNVDAMTDEEFERLEKVMQGRSDRKKTIQSAREELEKTQNAAREKYEATLREKGIDPEALLVAGAKRSNALKGVKLPDKYEYMEDGMKKTWKGKGPWPKAIIDEVGPCKKDDPKVNKERLAKFLIKTAEAEAAVGVQAQAPARAA
jgi:DNA-binding protein H-NS